MKTKTPLATETSKKLNALVEQVYETESTLPVLDRKEDSREWAEWRRWRINHDLSVAFMDAQRKWTVPLRNPPTDLNQAIREARPKSLSDRLAS